MSYHEFTLKQVIEKFKLNLKETNRQYINVKAVDVSVPYQDEININYDLALAINTEKARESLIVIPTLMEFKKKTDVSLFIDKTFDVDKELELVGAPDMLISKSKIQQYITSPVILFVEAKNNNIGKYLGQCAAEMYAAKLFNEKEKNTIDTVYGVVTTGDNYQFIKLSDNTVEIDNHLYPFNPGHIIAVLLLMAGEH